MITSREKRRGPWEGRISQGEGLAIIRLTRLLLLGGLILCAGAGMALADFWGRKVPNLPTDFIFGYGSLINTASRNSTSTNPIPAIPARVSGAFGYRRCWNDRSQSGFTALGLCKALPRDAGVTINGVVYPVPSGDLPKFDLREEGYTRVEVPLNLIEAIGWQHLPEQGHIWIYVPDDEGKEPDASFPLLQSYIDTVVEGGLEYGEDFAQEILATTFGWNQYWLNDRELARRPWVHDPKAAKVDALLKKTAPAAGHLSERMFAEEYAAHWFAPAVK